MTEAIIDSKEDLEFLNQFFSKMKQIKRMIDRENRAYEKGGVFAFGKVGDDFFQSMEDLRGFYYDLKKEEILSRLSKEKLDAFTQEHDSFLESMNRYEISCRVVNKVSDMLLEATKGSVQAAAKTDFGYDKNAELISDKKLMVNMPSMAINDKV